MQSSFNMTARNFSPYKMYNYFTYNLYGDEKRRHYSYEVVLKLSICKYKQFSILVFGKFLETKIRA